MQIRSESFRSDSRIPERCAFAKPHPETHIELSENRNPHLAWSDLPPGTQSLVLVCHDSDVPSDATDVNQEGKTVPATLPRVDFFHWVVTNLNPSTSPIKEGEFSNGITPRGKPGPTGPRGTSQGLNNYTEWFANDADMAGKYHGYDGPCPPWNDELLHHYHFTLYALDLAKCDVATPMTGSAVLEAIEGHVLEKATLTGTYSLNPEVGD